MGCVGCVGCVYWMCAWVAYGDMVCVRAYGVYIGCPWGVWGVWGGVLDVCMGCVWGHGVCVRVWGLYRVSMGCVGCVGGVYWMCAWVAYGDMVCLWGVCAWGVCGLCNRGVWVVQ